MRAACLVIAVAYGFDTLPGQELTTEEAMRLVGDRKAWRAIFSDNYPELVAEGFQWPEGPTWLEEEKALIFSDTVTGKMHRFKDGAVTVLRTSAGGCAVRTAACHCGAFWRSELLQKSLRAKMAGRMLVSHSTLAVLNASGRLESQFSSKRRALCKVATA